MKVAELADRELRYVGHSVARIDALEKVTGRARYCYDIFSPSMLYGAIVTSKHAHALVKAIDASEAMKLPGVRAVITADDVPNKRKGQLFFDRPIITRKARYVGDIVAAVAADSEEIAYEAARRVKIDYEPLPAVFDVRESFSRNPPVTIHEDLDELITASYGHPLVEHKFPFDQEREKDRPNVFTTFKGEVGDVDAAFQQGHLCIENEFRIGRAYHAAVEPHVAIADYNQYTGQVTIWSSCQCPYRAKYELCRLFDLDPAEVTFITPPVGGGFGSKGYLSIEDIALALSMKTGRPVRLAYTRRSDFISTVIRNGAHLTIRDAITGEGIILAREIEILFDAGAYNDATFKFVKSAIFAGAAAYSIENFRFRCYGVYTNTPVCGAFRGFGIPQVLWAVERQMDIVAERLGLDPLELRRRHLPRPYQINPLSRESMDDIKPQECLDRVVAAVAHDRKNMKRRDGPWMRGIGIALGNKPIHLHRPSATVKICSNGVIELRLGVQEIGSGSTTALAQLAAEFFGVPIENIRLILGDSRLTPYDEGTAGSRVTALTGNAVLRACRAAKDKLLSLASNKLGIDWRELEYEGGEIFVRHSPSERINISELFHKTMYGLPSVAIDGGEIVGSATYDLEAETHGTKKSHQSYTWGAQAVELEVNEETGKINILRVVTAVDIGRAINPELVKSQVEGGVAQAIGLTLYEELILNEKGEVLNENFLDYKIPTPLELPVDIETILVESEVNYGPFGAKSVGEFPLCVTPQTIAAALYDATGLQFHDMPITSEKVLLALKSRNR